MVCLPRSANYGSSNEASSRRAKTKNEWQPISNKINRPGADENWYAIIAQQGKDTLECQGVDVATQSAAIPTKIQQLFDDAGSMGGLLQTATLRGQIARFIHKHKVDDFR